MTGEEMERAIAFILEQQAQMASTQAQMASTQAEMASTQAQINSTMARLTERVERNAEGTTALLAIAEMHEREITENREAQTRTDERLNALIDTVERYISEGRNGKA
jgi:predicted transcriptional regulator